MNKRQREMRAEAKKMPFGCNNDWQAEHSFSTAQSQGSNAQYQGARGNH